MRKIVTFLLCLCALPLMAQNDQPLRVAVAGVAHGHLGNLTSQMRRGDFEVVAAWEENEAYRLHNDLARRLPADKFYADLEQMLDAERPEAVVAYGPIAHHLRVVEACAPRGIHVMVEKPLATTAKDARRIAALAGRYGIQVMTNYETTWYAANHLAREMVTQGAVGTLRRINVYDGHEGPKEIGCSQMFLDWLCDPVLNGGGAVVDFGCYGANLATWLMGGKRPRSVYAVLQHNKPHIYPLVDDDATIVLEYPGTTVQVMASWCWPRGRKDMYIYGDRGCLYQKNHNTLLLNDQPQDTKGIGERVILDSFRYFRALVRGEITEQPTDLSALPNNVIVCEILDAARKSARTGKAVIK
ncbi:MAG: Gfo/Idh/MocA family oxidoreductase [Bacteroidaceae bacterium]|nr:Gfo/Idh/MocA family oxidoreductase [Bacteroidaceae bacterium]